MSSTSPFQVVIASAAPFGFAQGPVTVFTLSLSKGSPQ